MHKKYQKIFFCAPHSICSKFPCGHRGGLRFALKRREVGVVYQKIRYTTKNKIWNFTSEREQTRSHEPENRTRQAPTDFRNTNYDMLITSFKLQALYNRGRHN